MGLVIPVYRVHLSLHVVPILHHVMSLVYIEHLLLPCHLLILVYLLVHQVLGHLSHPQGLDLQELLENQVLPSNKDLTSWTTVYCIVGWAWATLSIRFYFNSSPSDIDVVQDQWSEGSHQDFKMCQNVRIVTVLPCYTNISCCIQWIALAEHYR